MQTTMTMKDAYTVLYLVLGYAAMLGGIGALAWFFSSEERARGFWAVVVFAVGAWVLLSLH